MKKQLILLALLFSSYYSVSGQIYIYNQYPVLTETDKCLFNEVFVLDNVTTDNKSKLRIAYSLRKLRSDYNGPLIRLRCGSNALEKDFLPNKGGILDKQEVKDWRLNTCGNVNSDLFVMKWYNQVSPVAPDNLVIDAVQNNPTPMDLTIRQPILDIDNLEIKPDGINDFLTTGTSFRTHLSQTGADATVISVAKAANKTQFTFGVVNPNNRDIRWSVHLNWDTGSVFFDPGVVTTGGPGPRSYTNNAFIGRLTQYTFMRAETITVGVLTVSTATARRNGTNRLNNVLPSAYTRTQESFDIFNVGGGLTSDSSNSSMSELILFNDDISIQDITTIEENQIKFWCIQ